MAFSLDDVMRTGWAIIFSQFEGNKFDWNTLRFEADDS